MINISDFDDLSLISENKTSGSEYFPSTSSESSGEGTFKKEKEWWEVETICQNKVCDWLQNQTNDDAKNEKMPEKKENLEKIINISRNSGIPEEKPKLDKQKKINIIQNINVLKYIHNQDEYNATTNQTRNDLVNRCTELCDNMEFNECTSDSDMIVHTNQTEINNENNSKEVQNIFINKSQKRNGRRVRDKVHCCYFCMEKFIHMAKHFEQVHSNEMAVAKVLALDKHSRNRKIGFSELIRTGDFNHNCEVISIKKGELILVRRPTETESNYVSYDDYGPCPHCLGFMMKKHLWHHIKQCTKKSGNHIGSQNNKNIIAESEALLNQIYGGELSESFIREIVCKIRRDDIGTCCRDDNLILKFGAMLFEKYHTAQGELIRQSMRQLGK